MTVKAFGKHILCGIDFRDDWKHVVRHAARHARSAGAHLHLLHVAESGGGLSEILSKRDLQKHVGALEEEALERMEVEGREHAEEGKLSCHVGRGRPSKAVLEKADELKAGLIVLGASLPHGLEKLFVGTTADKVVRHAKVPTLVVGSRAPKPLKRLLVPTDLDRADQGALRVAAQLGMAHGARVSALHVISWPSLQSRYLGNVATLRRQVKARAKEKFHAFVESVELPEGAKRPHKILVANPDQERVAETIQADAVRLEIDLIVMALGGVNFFEHHVIGSTAEHLLRGLPCDLLALPQKWAKRR